MKFELRKSARFLVGAGRSSASRSGMDPSRLSVVRATMDVVEGKEEVTINNPPRKPARKLRVGDSLRLWSGKTAEILAIEEAVNQVGRKALILRLYKAGNMTVKRDTYVNMHYPE